MLVPLVMEATAVSVARPTAVLAATVDSAALHLYWRARAVLAVMQGTPTAA